MTFALVPCSHGHAWNWPGACVDIITVSSTTILSTPSAVMLPHSCIQLRTGSLPLRLSLRYGTVASCPLLALAAYENLILTPSVAVLRRLPVPYAYDRYAISVLNGFSGIYNTTTVHQVHMYTLETHRRKVRVTNGIPAGDSLPPIRWVRRLGWYLESGRVCCNDELQVLQQLHDHCSPTCTHLVIVSLRL